MELCPLLPALWVGGDLVLEDQVGHKLEGLGDLGIHQVGFGPGVVQGRGIVVEVPGCHTKHPIAPEGIGVAVVGVALHVGHLEAGVEEVLPVPFGCGRFHPCLFKDSGVVVHDHVVPGEGVLHLFAVDLEHFAQHGVNIVVQDGFFGGVGQEEIVEWHQDFFVGQQAQPFDRDHDDVELLAAGDLGDDPVGVACPASFADIGLGEHQIDFGELVDGAFDSGLPLFDRHLGGGDDADFGLGWGAVAGGGSAGGNAWSAGGEQRPGGGKCAPAQQIAAAQALFAQRFM